MKLEAFEKNPKNLVNPIFSEIFTKTTIEPIKVAQHIMASNTIVVSAIHQIFDNECFAPVMKSLLLQYQEIIDNKGDLEAELAEESINEDSLFNRLRNITIVFSYFYIFDDISIDFISGFLEHLLSHINVRTVEAILILVQHVGSKIRADNPSILKNVIDQTKKSVDAYTALLVANQKPIPKKLEFIMLTLNDIRLNKKQKTDPIQRLSFFTSWIKKNVLLKLKLTQKSFPIDFKYAYQSKKDTPRWYSTFETGAYRQGEQDEEDAQIQFGDRSELGHLNEATRKRLEALAIKCRMTTDTRKQIFMLVMSSEDYVDAAQRILKLKIVRKQLSEIAVVVIQCCAEEGKFNPYYVHLAAKLIEINPKIKFTFQYALWDQFKLIQDSQIRRISNLAKFLATMCSRKTLGITALKFFDLDQLSEQTVIFLKIFLSVFFDKISAEDLKVQVSKATARSENYVFVEGFKEFLKNYYWKFILSGKEKDNEQLKSAVKFTVKNLKMQLSKKELEGDD